MVTALKNAEDGFYCSRHDPVWNWKFRELKAEVLIWQGQSEQALNLLKTPPPPELATSEFAVRAKNAQGVALVILRRHPEAEGILHQAEELASKTAPYLLCETLLYEGNLAINLNQFSHAEERYRQSFQLARQYHWAFIESAALSSLGIVLTRLGRFDEAIEWASDALNLDRSSQYRLNENLALSNLAWSYQQLGDLEKATSRFSEELKVIDGLGQEQLKEDVFRNLGLAYAAQGNYPAAYDVYLRALDLARHNRDKFYLGVVLGSLALTAMEEGKLDDAEEYSRQASALDPHEEHALLIRAKLAAARHSFTEARSALEAVIAATSTEKYLRWDAEAELANVLAEQNQSNLAEGEFQKVIGEVEDERSRLKEVENRLAFSSSAGRFYDNYVRFLVAIGQPQKAFKVAEFSRARTLAENVGIQEAPAKPGNINIERIQSSLKPQNKIILAYWLTPNKSFVWLVSSAHFELFTLAGDSEIERKTREYNETLQGPEDPQNVEQQGQSLYTLLIAPVEKLIPHDAKVVIVPDGGLTKLNFETLRVPHPTPHFWIQDVELETASSSLFIRNRGEVSLAGRKALLIGDPVQASNDYPALAHAREELQRVESHFAPNQRTTVEGKDAIPSAFFSNYPGRFDFIHFVTHGTASELSPLESAIILSPQAENDFKLYAHDIVKTRLNADLVTISACYGLGRRTYSGEGLVGLAWAFLRAGAHQVVAGLWEVDDRASVQLMDDFYTSLQKWKSAAKALRAAKLKMVTSAGAYHRPYYWASLQLYIGS